MWENLISVLQKLAVVYEEQLALSAQKNAALVAVDMKEFKRILHGEQDLIAAVDRLEQQRISALRLLSEREKFADPPLKMLDLLSYCEAETGAELRRLHQRLQRAIAELKRSQQRNEFLIQQSLGQLNYRLNMLADAGVAPTYAAEGQERIAAAKWLDFKA